MFLTVVHGGGGKGRGPAGPFGPLEAVPPRRLHRRQAPVLLPSLLALGAGPPGGDPGWSGLDLRHDMGRNRVKIGSGLDLRHDMRQNRVKIVLGLDLRHDMGQNRVKIVLGLDLRHDMGQNRVKIGFCLWRACCTYRVCTPKPRSVALPVYIPPEKWPKRPFWPGYVQETGIPEGLRCTYPVCTPSLRSG